MKNKLLIFIICLMCTSCMMKQTKITMNGTQIKSLLESTKANVLMNKKFDEEICRVIGKSFNITPMINPGVSTTLLCNVAVVVVVWDDILNYDVFYAVDFDEKNIPKKLRLIKAERFLDIGYLVPCSEKQNLIIIKRKGVSL